MSYPSAHDLFTEVLICAHNLFAEVLEVFITQYFSLLNQLSRIFVSNFNHIEMKKCKDRARRWFYLMGNIIRNIR